MELLLPPVALHPGAIEVEGEELDAEEAVSTKPLLLEEDTAAEMSHRCSSYFCSCSSGERRPGPDTPIALVLKSMQVF